MESEKRVRTLAELAREALDVQDAVNLSGVVHSFSKAVRELREVGQGMYERGELEHFGTEWINRHPITVLWVDKLVSLSGQVEMEGFRYRSSLAFEQVQKLSEDFSILSGEELSSAVKETFSSENDRELLEETFHRT